MSFYDVEPIDLVAEEMCAVHDALDIVRRQLVDMRDFKRHGDIEAYCFLLGVHAHLYHRLARIVSGE